MLGFTVGARNRHPWGTHNRLVQTPGFFIELLEIVEVDSIPPHGESTFSFGAFNRDFLGQVGPGLSMLVLEGHDDPTIDKAEFDAAGFGGFDLFDFSRHGKRPDGEEVEVAFTLAFARDPASPHTGFFTCLQRRPENFWAPDLQRHMNGTLGIAGVVLSAEEPEAHLEFLRTFVEADFRPAVDGWYIARTPRGDVDLMSRQLFTERFGVPAPAESGLRLAAQRFAVSDIDRTRKRLSSSRMAAEEIEGIIVVGPKAALGATLVFQPAE